MKTIRVLVIDDSALVREVLTEGLNLDSSISVVGTASDPYSARDKIVTLKPDVLTLDVDMPRMNGVDFLRKLMPQYPLPTVMVSAHTEKGAKITLDAIDAGAIDFVTKPRSGLKQNLANMLIELRTKIKIASVVNVSHWKTVQDVVTQPSATEFKRASRRIVAIGASTGGTDAIKQVITRFPPTIPGVVIVQHMPEKFTKTFAERMNSICSVSVKEAENGDRVVPGSVLIAPGSHHMEVVTSVSGYEVRLNQGENVCGHRPSVEVLMQSVARCAGADAVGVLLTGMGEDGADGMVSMKRKGASTIAQDEQTSVVFGMPKQAYDRGGVDFLLPLNQIADEVIRILKKP